MNESDVARRIEDRHLWARDGAGPEDAIADVMAAGWRGLALRCPEAIELDRADAFPALTLRVATFGPGHVQPHLRALVLIASERRTHALRVGRAHVDPRAQVAPDVAIPAPTDDPDATPMVMSEVVRSDLREHLHVPWAPGEWVVTGALCGQLTNQAVTRLVGPDPTPSWTVETDPSPAPLPAFGAAAAGAPPPPAAPGIELSLEPVRVIGSGPLVLKGSFRLPATGVARGAATATPGSRVGAFTSVGLVVVGVRDLGPTAVLLRLPADEQVVADPDAPPPLVTGAFALDLAALAPFDGNRPQSYHVFAVAGDVLRGPFTVSTVDEAMLRDD
ncbi:MAG: hypothetical protein KF878_19580 [Planctomycetes bacterium]|nr:hypothetical protein [Planctomycetota bacterium]